MLERRAKQSHAVGWRAVSITPEEGGRTGEVPDNMLDVKLAVNM